MECWKRIIMRPAINMFNNEVKVKLYVDLIRDG